MLKDKYIIIGIYTCPKFDQRAAGIRHTWLKNLPKNFRVIFVMAQPGREARLDGSVLYVDCPEAYENLPQKSHLFFKYCADNFDFDYVFKTDDDTYLDLLRFGSFDPKNGDYIGVFRDEPLGEIGQTWHYGKCKDKSFEVPYKAEFICGWALGGGYLVSRNAVNILVRSTRNTFRKNLFEDKMVGEALTMTPGLKIVRTNYSKLGVINPLLPKDMLYVHGIILERDRLLRENQVLGEGKENFGKKLDAGIDFGSLRRLKPISKCWGFDRGSPVDRYYIESFLESNSTNIRGRVLEIKDSTYTKQYGGVDVEVSDVLDIDESNSFATIVTDVTNCNGIQSNYYDCIIITQTLQYVYSLEAALASLYRILKPGGTLLVTCPGISKVEFQRLGDTTFWSFTEASLRRLLSRDFINIVVSGHGNVLVSAAFLYGVAHEELDEKELNFHDPDFSILITGKAVKQS